MTPPPERPRESGTRLLDVAAYVLLAGFVVVTLGPALAGRGALIDVDVLTRYAPFSALHGVHVGDAITCRTDTLNYYLPGIHAIRSAFFSGDFPTWAPYEVGGVPLASVPNHAALSPLSLPWFLLPLWLAPAYVKLLEVAVAVGGMFGFLRRHGVSRGASVVAGLVFASSGFMMMWTNWPHTRVAAFIPALFWALERTVQQRKPVDIVLVGAVVASMLLGGFPAVTLYTLTVAAAYVVVRALSRSGRDPRAVVPVLLRAGAGVALGIGLAAIQLFPFVLNLDTLGLEQRDSKGLHLPLGLFLTTGAPDSIGLCVGGQAYGPVNPVEGVGFLGIAALVVVVCAFVVRPGVTAVAADHAPRRFLGIALVVVTILVWVGGPLLAAVQLLPFFSTNSIARAQSVFGFLGAALVGVGLDRLRGWWARPAGEGRAGGGRHLPGSVILGVVVAWVALVLVRGWSDARRDGYVDHWLHALVVPTVFLVAALAVVLLGRRVPTPLRRFAPVVLAVLVVAQSAMFAHTVLRRSDRANLYPETPTHAYLQAHLRGERFGASGATMYPAGADFYGLRTPVGHEFADPRWWDVLGAVAPGIRVSPTYSLFPISLTAEKAAHSAPLDQLAVRYWVGTAADVAGRPEPLGAAPDTVALRPSEVGHCEVRGGALRGVQVQVARPRNVPTARPAVLHVRVHTPRGVVEGSRLLGGRLPRVPAKVAVAGEDLSGPGRYPVDVWITGVRGLTRFGGTGERLGCAAVRPVDDGLRLVFAEAGDTVYERLTALPRIRWAGRSVVVPDAAARVARVKKGVPDDTVLLDDDSTPAAQGSTALVRVRSDRPEGFSADVRARGRGYLVVADAEVRDGWVATVDGRPVRVVHGNHAFAAIPVPSGVHRVVFSYHAPGLRAGVATSLVSVLVAIALLVWPAWSRRRARARSRKEQALP